jgi:hypothetical protein
MKTYSTYTFLIKYFYYNSKRKNMSYKCFFLPRLIPFFLNARLTIIVINFDQDHYSKRQRHINLSLLLKHDIHNSCLPHETSS